MDQKDLHRRHLGNRRNHAQSAHNDPHRHPDDARRAPIHQPILRREQDALPRRLKHHDEADDGDEAKIPPQFLPFAHAAHVVGVVPSAAILLLSECRRLIIANVGLGGGLDFDSSVGLFVDGVVHGRTKLQRTTVC